MNAISGQDVQFCNVKPSGTYSNDRLNILLTVVLNVKVSSLPALSRKWCWVQHEQGMQSSSRGSWSGWRSNPAEIRKRVTADSTSRQPKTRC